MECAIITTKKQESSIFSNTLLRAVKRSSEFLINVNSLSNYKTLNSVDAQNLAKCVLTNTISKPKHIVMYNFRILIPFIQN